MQNHPPVPPAYRIESVDNVLRLLLLLQDGRAVRVTDASEHLGVARSTAHRLLGMLVYYEFAEQDQKTRAYRCGSALRNIGLAALGGFDLRLQCRPYLERLARETGETSNFLVLEGTMVRFIESVEGTQVVRLSSRAGVSRPAHWTAGGKALLAELSSEELRALYPGTALEGRTEATHSSLDALELELEKVRELGYAVNLGESEKRLHAVGMCVRDRSGRAVGALAVGGPSERLTRSVVASIVQRLTVAAVDLQRKLA